MSGKLHCELCGIDIAAFWFQQDGATAVTAPQSMNT
jgi:hypothetical protein